MKMAAERVQQQNDGDDEPWIESRRSAVGEAVAQLVDDALNVCARIITPTWRRNVLPISHQRVARQAAPERNSPD
jgi:hypothetical protein